MTNLFPTLEFIIYAFVLLSILGILGIIYAYLIARAASLGHYRTKYDYFERTLKHIDNSESMKDER